MNVHNYESRIDVIHKSEYVHKHRKLLIDFIWLAHCCSAYSTTRVSITHLEGFSFKNELNLSLELAFWYI